MHASFIQFVSKCFPRYNIDKIIRRDCNIATEKTPLFLKNEKKSEIQKRTRASQAVNYVLREVYANRTR